MPSVCHLRVTQSLQLLVLIVILCGMSTLCGCERCQGCSGCSGEQRVAELVELQKRVERDFAASVEKWQRASAGDGFRIGDGLKTGPEAQATLRLFPEGRLLVQSDTVLRFQATPPGEQERRLQVTTGTVEIESAGADLRLYTEVGVARIERNSRVRLRSSGDSPGLEVLVGGARIERGGETVGVAAGETLELEIGGVSVERQPAEPEPGPVDAGQPAVDAAATAEGDQPEDKAETAPKSPYAGPETADLSVKGGESATLHDPSPPTDVRVPLDKCEHGGAVEIKRRGARGKYFRVGGDKSAVLRLPAGSYLYRVRCASRPGSSHGRVAARGRLSVRRDAGLKKLPQRPPSVTVDADGRTYTVRYQNRLPRITVRWLDAPKASKYQLRLAPQGQGAETRTFSIPRVVFKSGELGEGSHRFSFGAAGGRKSPETRLKIAFDNMSRTASVSEPPEGKAVAGETIIVAGEALSRSRVSVLGRQVKTDGQGRFRSEVVVPADRTAIAVRVRQRSGQVHYFLRNLASRAANGLKRQ